MIIRSAEVSDALGVKEIYSQEHAISGTLQPPFPTLEQWKAKLSHKSENSITLVAEIDEKIVGHLVLLGYSNPRRKHAAYFGMAVHRDFTKQGIGSELLNEAIKACDDWLNISRIELEVFADNAAAIALYKKLGFKKEGVLRKHSYKNGNLLDVLVMARVKR